MPNLSSMPRGEANSFNFGWVLSALAMTMPHAYLVRGVQAMLGYWYDASDGDPEPDLMVDILIQCAVKGRYDNPENVDMEETYGISLADDLDKEEADEAAVQAFLDLLAGFPETPEPEAPDTPTGEQSNEESNDVLDSNPNDNKEDTQ